MVVETGCSKDIENPALTSDYTLLGLGGNAASAQAERSIQALQRLELAE
jgi:hypothetical protein